MLDLPRDRALIFGKWQELQTTSVGHYALYIVPMEDKPEDCLPFFMPVEKEEKKAVILKLHRQFGHPGREVLENLLKKAALWDRGLSEILTQIHGQCKTCRLFSQTPPRPVVGLPPASEFGDVLTRDLKEIKAGSVLEVEKLRAALLLEQGCQEMGQVVTYLEKAKESLEKERVAEVAKIQEELSGKLLAEQGGRKKAEQRLEVLETGLAEARVEEFVKLKETLKSVEVASKKQLVEKEEIIQETTERLEKSESQLASLLDSFNSKELAWKTEKDSGLE